ncbi:30S ribosomal protein S6 [bacterium]|nr:30S ribosomal protein S6 [bacterium]
MCMNRYEILMLATPAITQDEASNVEKGIQEIVKEVKGSVISFERWGKFRLAYPVKKNDYGIYFLTRFEVPTTQPVLETIKTAFTVKYNEIVMRHVVVKLDTKQSLEYKRPQSVEDAPVARDVDSFLRENNMEGLRGSGARDNDKRSEALGTDLDESFNDEELN